MTFADSQPQFCRVSLNLENEDGIPRNHLSVLTPGHSLRHLPQKHVLMCIQRFPGSQNPASTLSIDPVSTLSKPAVLRSSLFIRRHGRVVPYVMSLAVSTSVSVSCTPTMSAKCTRTGERASWIFPVEYTYCLPTCKPITPTRSLQQWIVQTNTGIACLAPLTGIAGPRDCLQRTRPESHLLRKNHHEPAS